MRKKRAAAVTLAAARKTDVVRRLKTARGHLEGVLGMIEDDASCIDLLTQLSAIGSALNQVSHLIVQHHLDCCFMELVRSGDEKTAVADLLRTLAYDTRSA
ncbi:MAG TPA: metal-sensitive transcriptional regulator [Candidatus Baltobacteraceae bacterium]|nr:metal-sensitive transcriptional regulator [Candidatus Baltobacteraceae bacterium]